MGRNSGALLLALLVSTTPAIAAASAGADPVEIRLGQRPPPAPRPDRAKIQAVERFLTARQTASFDPARKGEARRLLAGSARPDDATLIGERGARIIAFDFHDGGIEPAGAGRFTVSAYLLFADPEGAVMESRDEALTFALQGGEYRCVSLKSTNVIAWDSEAVAESAAALGAAEALTRAETFLRGWAGGQRRGTGFSLADIQRTDSGALLVQCRRFTARIGRRGYDVTDSPLVLNRSAEGYRVEAN